MANLRLVDHYIPGIAGGCCYFCRTSQRHDNGTPEAVVATSVELSEGGEIALCGSCVAEMASLIGLVAGDAAQAAVAAAEADLAVAVELVANAELRASDAEAALRTVVGLSPAASVVPAEPTDPPPLATPDATSEDSKPEVEDSKPARKARSAK